MQGLYNRDLAYVHAVGFESFALAAAAEIVRRLKTASIPITRVVDIGCGAGPLSKALADEGFAVTGVDTSSELLEMAHRRVPAARFIHASAYEAPIGPCEAIVALGEPLTYHDGSADADNLVRRLFQRAGEVLPEGGLFIFDVIELGEPSLAGRFWSSGDDWAVLVDTTEDQANRTLVRDIEIFRRVGESYRRVHEFHKVRLFDARALCDQLRTFGFSTETTQCYGAQPLLPRRRAIFATRMSQ